MKRDFHLFAANNKKPVSGEAKGVTVLLDICSVCLAAVQPMVMPGVFEGQEQLRCAAALFPELCRHAAVVQCLHMCMD